MRMFSISQRLMDCSSWWRMSAVAGVSSVLLSMVWPAAAIAEYPSFGIIASVTGETQFVIDVKSSPDAKPDRDQRVINVAGVRGSGRDNNAVFQLERLVLGRDVTLKNCTRRPLNPQQLFCDVVIDLGRSTAPAVSLAQMLRTWGLAQASNDTATTVPTPVRGDNATSFKPLPAVAPASQRF